MKEAEVEQFHRGAEQRSLPWNRYKAMCYECRAVRGCPGLYVEDRRGIITDLERRTGIHQAHHVCSD